MSVSVWAWVGLAVVLIAVYVPLLLMVIGTPEERAETRRKDEERYATRLRMGLVSEEEKMRRSGLFHG